jgi:hypothetical protein
MGSETTKPTPGPQGEPVPHGFRDFEQFREFGAALYSGLPPGTQPLVQGSAVTGRSYRTGQPFDQGRTSDFDVALAGADLFASARQLGLKAKDGTRIGPLNDAQLEALGLLELRDRVQRLAGRPVRFMLFESLEAGLKRPSLWVPSA